MTWDGRAECAPRIEHMRAADIIDQTYRMLPKPSTVSEAIHRLTGYRATNNCYDTVSLWDTWWSKGCRERDAWMNACASVPVAFHGYSHRYFYRRDVIRALLPRWRCEVCARKPRKTEWVLVWVANSRSEWKAAPPVTRGPYDPTHDACRILGMTSYWRDGRKCGKRCWEIERATLTGNYDTELFKYWKAHRDRLVCSRACHRAMAERFRREINHLQEMRKWVQEGTESLSQLKSVLRKLRGQRAPQSRSKGLSRRETFAI